MMLKVLGRCARCGGTVARVAELDGLVDRCVSCNRETFTPAEQARTQAAVQSMQDARQRHMDACREARQRRTGS